MNTSDDFLKKHPYDIAEAISALKDKDQILAFILLSSELKSEVFAYFDNPTQENLIKSLSSENLAKVLEEMSPDDRTAIFEDFPDILIKDVINFLSIEERNIALNLIGYQEGTVGRIMTPYYVQAKKNWTVKYTLQHIKKQGKKAETLDFIYIVDENQKLIDDIRLAKLLLSNDDNILEDLMDNEFVSLKAKDNKENAIIIFDDYDRSALPVTSDNGVLVGIVTFDDILDEVEKRDTEDFQKIAAVEALSLPYLETSVLDMFKKRSFWLVLLFLGELFTTTAMGRFEDEIAKFVVLALFVPLIISSGGNTGSQSTTLIVRAMALQEIRLRDWFFVMKKEFLSGLFLGILLGVIGFLRIAIWQYLNITNYGENWFFIALTISLSLLGVVLWGSLIGSMIPFILKKFNLDPATSSAPFVATIVDVTGLIFYFSIASFLLSGTLFK
ncbi:MAG: magnesium transporter [Solirubrobacteraceae bacterium]